MKKAIGIDVGSYVFDASGRTVTITGLQGAFALEQVLLITNVTAGVIIYNFAGFTGTLTGNVLTLAYDTTAMSDTDRLQIIMDLAETEIEVAPANVVDNQLSALIETLQELCRSMAALAAAKGIAGDIRVTPLATPNMTTLTTLSNITSIGGYAASGVVEDLANMAAQCNINNVVG